MTNKELIDLYERSIKKQKNTNIDNICLCGNLSCHECNIHDYRLKNETDLSCYRILLFLIKDYVAAKTLSEKLNE